MSRLLAARLELILKCYNESMNKPITFLIAVLLVVVIATLAILWVLNVITQDQAIDLGVKLTAVLLIGLVASLAVGMLGKNTDEK